MFRDELDNYATLEEGFKYVNFQDSLNLEYMLYLIDNKSWPGRRLIKIDEKYVTLLTHSLNLG